MDNPYYDIDEFHMPDEYAVDDEEEYPPVQPRGYERLMVPHQSLDNDSLDMDLEDDYMPLSSPTPYRAPTQSIPQIKQNKARSGFGMAGKPWYTPNPNQIPEFHDHMELQRPRIGFFGERNSVHDATQHLTPLNSTPCPLNRQGIQLRPVSDLPDRFRGIFKFGVFNAVQSTCYEEIINHNENMVISAPTGSGKTVLFELGIIRAFRSGGTDVKAIYIAPTKALCSERFSDWKGKFDPLGLRCCELTGDTVVFGGNTAWGDAKKASIIITTVRPLTNAYPLPNLLQCEKWDSLTRNWNESSSLFSQIKLMLIDEVHILNESRGSTLEVVTSRMKLKGSAVRFILVSATVPNIGDVAQWIGSSTEPTGSAKVFEFGEEFRPCKLVRHVVPVPRHQNQNDFQFINSLNYKVFPVIQQYTEGKPTLIFCATRNGTLAAAECARKEYVAMEEKRAKVPWKRPPRANASFHEKRLEELYAVGVGVHHAGLSTEDRRIVEQHFSQKRIQVLFATSTLAVGVNLPAHMVVINGVHSFQNGGWKEYSDLDIVQMLGRAGRPQFDASGIAVILCEAALKYKYEALVHGTTVLESSLHLNLTEHLNSEISMGTIRDIESAKSWLRSSFLYQRVKKNPGFYALTEDGPDIPWQERINEVVTTNVKELENSDLVKLTKTGKEAGKLFSTEFGDIMSKFYIRRQTMILILGLPPQATMRQLLEMISKSEELRDVTLRSSERMAFNKLRDDNDIRFKIPKVETASDKIFVLIQAILGGISLTGSEFKTGDSQLFLEAFSIFKHINRICRGIVEVAVVKKHGAQIKYGLELLRCISAKAWEDRAIVLRQIEHIGEKSIKILAEHGITSIAALRKESPIRIEALLNRRHPFGLQVCDSVAELPDYALSVSEERVEHSDGKGPVEVELKVECHNKSAQSRLAAQKSKKSGANRFQSTSILSLASDMDVIDYRRIRGVIPRTFILNSRLLSPFRTKLLDEVRSFTITATLTKPSQTVTVIVTSENIAGVTVTQNYKPSLPASCFPTPNTRPLTSIEQDLIGLEDDPDFWNMTIDSEDEPFTKEGKQSMSSAQPTKPNGIVVTINEARKLRNGNYALTANRCNHLCKDKTKCRHICCREGLPRPPAANKRKARDDAFDVSQAQEEKSKAEEAKPKRTYANLQRIAVPPKPKVSEKMLQATQKLHEKSATQKHLQMVDGQRRKIEAPPMKKDTRMVPSSSRPTTLTGLATLDSLDSGEESDDLPSSLVQLVTVGGSSFTVSEQPSNLEHDLHPRKKAKMAPSLSLFLNSDSDIEISSPIPVSVPVSAQDKPKTQKETLTSNQPSLGAMEQEPEKTEAQNQDDDDDFADLMKWIAEGNDIVIDD